MGNVNMEAYQVHFEGKSLAEKLKELDAIAQQIEDLPTFTSNDRVFLEAVPAMPTDEGKTVLTAMTDNQGNTELTYETPDVEGCDIAPVFDDTASYSEGDLVYYDGVLYKFDADHAAGAWDPTEATQTSVAAEFNQLKNTLTSVEERIDANVLSDVKTALVFNTEYVVPADGYLRGTVNPGSSKYITLLVKCTDDTWYTLAQTGDTTIISPVISLFVRKGMSVQFRGSSSTDVSCYFIPLTSND